MLTRAAEMGFAPAQACLSTRLFADEENEVRSLQLAQKAAAQGHLHAKYLVAFDCMKGSGCEMDVEAARELFKEAADLGHFGAPYFYGKLAFGRLHWERFMWWGISADKSYREDSFCDVVLAMLPLFEKGEHGRILHTVAPVIRKNLNVEESKLFGEPIDSWERSKFKQVLELHEAMLMRARRAIDCWSIAARRNRVVKDIRVAIAKMVWKRAWIWGENQADVVLRQKLKRAEERGEVIGE
jgi:hypothetical protein